MKLMKTCLTAIISSLMIFSPMAYADKWSDQFPHIKATGDIPGDCSYEKMSKKNYKGKTLKNKYSRNSCNGRANSSTC